MFCTTCGTKLPLNAAFCPGCGTKVEVPSQTPEWAKPREVSAEPDAQAMPTPIVGAGDRAAQAGNEGAVRKESALGATRKPRPSIVRIIELVILSGLLSLLACVVLAYLTDDSNLWNTPDPPIKIAERSGILSDCVFCVKNLAKGTITFTIKFKDKVQTLCTRTVIMSGGEDKEFGALELDGYKPKRGDRVVVRVDGYEKSLECKLGEREFWYTIRGKTMKEWERRRGRKIATNLSVCCIVIFVIVFVVNRKKGKR